MAAPLLYWAKAEAPLHDKLGHPECAARGSAILEALDAAGLTEHGQACGPTHPNMPAPPLQPAHSIHACCVMQLYP